MDQHSLATTDYLGAFQYLDGKLDFLPHAEGYVKAVHTGSATEYHYVYNYTDHLGNIRLSYGRDPETGDVAILKENHYYPFGLQHQGYVTNHKIFDPIAPIGRVNLIPVRNYLDDSYRYTFGGKEEQPELGLNWIDHHARNYMPDLGRWMSPDPLAEEYSSWSPYNYVMNSPLRFIDPTGMFVEESKDPPVEIDGGALNPVHIIASSSGTNLTALGYSKVDFSIRAQIIRDGGPIATALISAENKGLYRPLIDARRPYAGFSSEFSAGWNNIDKDGIGNFWMNATAVGVGVPLLAASPLSAGLFSRGSLQAGLLKSGVSASVQFVINQQINFVGAFADGFMLPGVGDFVGAGLDVGWDYNYGFYSNTIFRNKTVSQAFKQGLVSTMFNLKMSGIDV